MSEEESNPWLEFGRRNIPWRDYLTASPTVPKHSRGYYKFEGHSELRAGDTLSVECHSNQGWFTINRADGSHKVHLSIRVE